MSEDDGDHPKVSLTREGALIKARYSFKSTSSAGANLYESDAGHKDGILSGLGDEQVKVSALGSYLQGDSTVAASRRPVEEDVGLAWGVLDLLHPPTIGSNDAMQCSLTMVFKILLHL